MVARYLSLLAGLPAVMAASQLVQNITFNGGAGQAVDTTQWTIRTDLHVNNEVETYTTSTQNIQLSGNGTIQIIPRKDAQGQWTSGRLESKATFTPQDGKVTRFESVLRMGGAAAGQSQGIWPAFWMLGDSINHGTDWPDCGELDIMERINGKPQGQGTPHCGPGAADPCGALTAVVPLANVADFHNWAIEVDRTNPDINQQVVTWFLDDKAYNNITGAKVNNPTSWKALTASPLFFILNVAVGGNFPGAPNDQTADGAANLMEVAFVAVSTL